jgi:Flp pilus assembly protein CpaB
LSSRRTAILIGAIAIGIVAVLLIVQYVHGIQDQVNADNETVDVFVAKNDIKRGTEGNVAVDDGSIDAAKIPRKFAPSTAIQSTDAVNKKVALFDIAPGTVIVTGMFVDPSTTQISFRERLSSPKHVAISISADGVKAVGGFLVPGDEVNMMIYQDNAEVKTAAESDPNQQGSVKGNMGGGAGLSAAITPKDASNYVNVGGPQWMIFGNTARYMYQKVKIIAVGSNLLLTPGEQASSTSSSNSNQSTSTNNGVITVEVPPVAAQWIATGQSIGFYLSLVAKDYVPEALLPLPVIVDRLPGEDSGKLCPYYDQSDKNHPEPGCVAG